ncbi:MAG TPA: hypothetical protein VNT81_18615 [Vicinamibacterales bacterium]|nr:hypothetical protein [Vicinamibacterales bacterium]
MTALERVRAILADAGVRCALIGAAALAARGVARSTFDIDLLTTDRRVLDARAWAALPSIAVDIRRGDVDDPLAGVVRITLDADRPIDVVVGKHPWQARAVERAEVIDGGMPIVLARDLVLLKLYAGGTQDLWDIRELLARADKTLAAEVTADLAPLPPELRQQWESIVSETHR